jgi:hypothetical protein
MIAIASCAFVRLCMVWVRIVSGSFKVYGIGSVRAALS